MSTASSSAEQPGLVFFYSPVSGSCRRVEGFLAQVLQRRRNHGTFKLDRVDEERQRRAVAKLEPLDVEGKPRPASHHRLTAGAVDSLAHAGERRQRAGDPPNVPDPVELAHPQPKLTMTDEPSCETCDSRRRSRPIAQPRSASKSEVLATSRTGPGPSIRRGPL